MKARLLMLIAALVLLPARLLADPSQTFELVAVDNSAVLPGSDSLVPAFNDGSYFTFDLMITTVDADFDVADAEASLTGPSVFFEHPAGGFVPPTEDLVAQYPAVEFDTFFDGGPGSVVDGAFFVHEPQLIHAGWWDSEAYLPNDTYRIARFSFQFLEPGTATLTVEGSSHLPPGHATLTPIGPLTVSVDYVPEPSMLALLALGGPLSLRRRA